MAMQTIWAVARNNIAQAIRLRVAFVIMALYLVLVPAIPFFVRGDGTLRGLLHVVIGYSLIVAGALLGVLTLTLSTTTLWTELRDKQIYLIEARPVRRWQLLLGKFLGILIINAALMIFMGLVTWGSVHMLARQKRWDDKRTPQGAEKTLWAHKERDLARRQVLVARRTVDPEPPPETEIRAYVKQFLEARVKELTRRDKMPPGGRDEVARELVGEYYKLINVVRPRMGRRWRFAGLPTHLRPDDRITVRLKFFSSDTKTDEPDFTRWEFTQPPDTVPKGQRPRAYRYDQRFLPDELHEIHIPADVIGPKGDLEVRYYNLEPRRPTHIFSGTDAIQVLTPVGGFAANLARGLAVIFVEVTFIAALGLFCSTFLTFPVSPIVALAILLLIILTGAVSAEFEKGLTFDQNKESKTAMIAEKFARGVTAAAHFILPPFDRYRPADRVCAGEEVSWGTLVSAAAWIGLFYGGLLTVLGAFIFQRRELALAAR